MFQDQIFFKHKMNIRFFTLYVFFHPDKYLYIFCLLQLWMWLQWHRLWGRPLSGGHPWMCIWSLSAWSYMCRGNQRIHLHVLARYYWATCPQSIFSDPEGKFEVTRYIWVKKSKSVSGGLSWSGFPDLDAVWRKVCTNKPDTISLRNSMPIIFWKNENSKQFKWILS